MSSKSSKMKTGRAQDKEKKKAVAQQPAKRVTTLKSKSGSPKKAKAKTQASKATSKAVMKSSTKVGKVARASKTSQKAKVNGKPRAVANDSGKVISMAKARE